VDDERTVEKRCDIQPFPLYTFRHTCLTRWAAVMDLVTSGSSRRIERVRGVIIMSRNIGLGVAIEQLLLTWAGSEPEEWRNRLLWIPL
jgi:hypothetical protein